MRVEHASGSCRKCILAARGEGAPSECERYDFDESIYPLGRPWFLPDDGRIIANCEICKVRFPVRVLIEHVKRDHIEEFVKYAPFKCNMCDEAFYDEVRVRRHERDCVRVADVKRRLVVLHKCPFCPKESTLYAVIRLSKHLRQRHPLIIKYCKRGGVGGEFVPKPFGCSNCPMFSCDSATALVKHWEDGKGCGGVMTLTAVSNYEPLIKYLGEKQPKEVCEEAYETDDDERAVPLAFESHGGAAYDEVEAGILATRMIPRVCPYCLENVYCRTLQYHIAEFHGKHKKTSVKESCKLCRAVFWSRFSAAIHSKKKCEEKQRLLRNREHPRMMIAAECAVCGQQSPNIALLSQHYRLDHTDLYKMCMSSFLPKGTVQLLTCTKCGLTSASDASLLNHFINTPDCEDGVIRVEKSVDIAHLDEPLKEYRKMISKPPEQELRKTKRVVAPNLERQEWMDKVSRALAPAKVKQAEAVAAMNQRHLNLWRESKRKMPRQYVSRVPKYIPSRKERIAQSASKALQKLQAPPAKKCNFGVKRKQSGGVPLYVKCGYCGASCAAAEILSHREQHHATLHMANAPYACDCGSAHFYNYRSYVKHVEEECTGQEMGSPSSSFRYDSMTHEQSMDFTASDYGDDQQPSTSTGGRLWQGDDFVKEEVEEEEEEEGAAAMTADVVLKDELAEDKIMTM